MVLGCGFVHHPVPPPSLQMRVGGALLVLTHHTTTHSPSLASNVSRRGCFQSSLTTPPPIPPPSLQMRVGGVVYSLDPPSHHLFPLPHFKLELEGEFLLPSFLAPPLK